MTTIDIQSSIADLVSVEPKSIAADKQAQDAAAWLSAQKSVEADVEAALGPAIREAYAQHKELTGQKKTLLEKLEAAKNRVRYGLANWIAAGHPIKGMYTKVTYKIIVEDPALLPDEYKMVVANMPALEAWAKLTEGKQSVKGCVIEPVHVLYSGSN